MKRTVFLLMFLAVVGASAQSYDYWPNPESHTNSDAWLRVHHQEIKLLRPNVLVLVADNSANMDAVKSFVQRAISGVADGSRYHGYQDPKIPVQLMYQVVKIVDLRDHTLNQRWPKIWPVERNKKGKPDFRYAGLFTDEFAKAMGYRDPKNPERFLNLRALFEDGIINEVWMVFPEIDGQPEEGMAGVFETTARVQVYGEDGKPMPGKFDRCAGNGCMDDPGANGESNVTMRFTELNIGLGPGCFLHASGHGFDNGLSHAVPEFRKASEHFFNMGLKRDGLPFDSLYTACPSMQDANCFKYPNDHTLESVSVGQGIPKFKDDNWGHGCGNVHFPPNGRNNDDYSNGKKVLSSCENYGLHNGKDGQDAQTEFINGELIAKYEHLWPDCGGGWQVYMRMNFPGYGSAAKNTDGTAMKSWWPYFYY